jgi:hypothetical protein
MRTSGPGGSLLTISSVFAVSAALSCSRSEQATPSSAPAGPAKQAPVDDGPVVDAVVDAPAASTPAPAEAVDLDVAEDAEEEERLEEKTDAKRRRDLGATGLEKAKEAKPAARPAADPIPETKRETKSGVDEVLGGELDRLSRLENQLRAAGLKVAGRSGGAVAASDISSNAAVELSESQCTDVCTVTDSICALEKRICVLARSHADDERYRNACARAQNDCQVGSAACTKCSG